MEANKIIISSPIRKALGNNESIPFKDLIYSNLNKVMEEIELINNKNDTTLKVVIVGEVKSGKSTFVNALLSREVSKTDVLESTSKIIEIGYSNKPSLKEFEGVTKIGLDIDFLNKINIVDTPGLKSITVENEEKTMKYINNADIILFVFDATHIGQEDIEDVLDIISSYKKKIIGIINKSDLLEENREKVMAYIEEEYDIYIDTFFMVSSYLEYQYKLSMNARAGQRDLVVSSYTDLRENFEKLNRYLDEIYINSERIKLSSKKSSLENIIHKEINYHHEYTRSILVLMDELKRHERLLKNKLDYINSKMDFEINDWINRVFFSEEISKIKEDMDNIKYYINENYINDIINKKKIELDELYFNEWQECLKEVNEEIDGNLKKYVDNINYKNELIDAPIFKVNYEKGNINEILATVGTGAILGATSGTVVSVYAAGIGSQAASVTIGSALLTYCPPLLIAGTLTGAIGKLIYDKIKNDKMSKEILEDIDNFREKLKVEIIETLKNNYSKSSIDIISTTSEIYKNAKGIYMNKIELEQFIEKINMYEENLKKYI